MPARTLKLLVEYDGTDFCGWQWQKDGRSVQGCIEDAFMAMCQTKVAVRGAGRTDAGVHAQGQVAAADVDVAIPALGFLRGLNSHLPEDVAILDVAEAAPGFDPRRASRGKIYRYRIWNHAVRSPLERRRTWQFRAPLDAHLMRAAAAVLVGEHDFRAFRASDCERLTTRRVLRRVDVSRRGPEITVEVEGTAFLKNMVRIIAGTLVAAGRGELGPPEIAELLVTGDRTKAGMTAPAAGLTLVTVIF